MGAGRVLNFEGMQLAKAGIATVEGKIKLNKKLQTTNKNIYVSGDAANNMKFSHAAEMHTGILLNNFVSPIKKKLNLEHFPWVTYTEPEISTFGWNEKQLKEQNIAYERLATDFSEHDRAITDNYEYGKLVLFIEKKKNILTTVKILGGSMVAPNAGEITQELILANSTGLSAEKLMAKIYPYPTAANINKITIRKRTVRELKPWMKIVLRGLYNL
jgi:pyruvate/2-oxoglutarate dehydrogenase complex dihydrolipoamide dehydrogenase (E3) component